MSIGKVYLSAGHIAKGSDPGAVFGKYKEAELTAELRDLIKSHLEQRGITVEVDSDTETLSQYLKRIKPTAKDVVVDLHFNAAESPLANGTEVFVKERKGVSHQLAYALCEAGLHTGFRNRGVKIPSESNRGKLGLFRLNAGAVVLPEVCFITGPDMQVYERGKLIYAQLSAEAIHKALQSL